MFLFNLKTFVIVLFVTSCVFAQHRYRKKTCRKDEFRCKNGACVPLTSQCNGKADCPDGSDETFPLCRNNTCSIDEFRCTYGACIDLSLRCDEKQDCVDNSDELVPLCRNDFTDFHICEERIIEERQYSPAVDCRSLRQTCDDGQVLKEPTRCDGHVDCADGSDETVARCAEAECVPPLFRCAYGGCAHPRAACDGVRDCADGSDEMQDLCDRILPATTPKPICILPAYPENGRYTLGGNSTGAPGQMFPSVVLKYSCDPQHVIVGSNTLFCYLGQWSQDFPECSRYCTLPKHDSVEYRCSSPDDETLDPTIACEEQILDGATIYPRCRQPVYYSPVDLLPMRCENGTWDRMVTCVADCGRLGDPADPLLLGSGREARRNELPWHVAIFKGTSHEQWCSGTIIRNNVVISAAHCFWSQGRLLSPTNFVVAAGKLYRTWGHPNDSNVQISDIREIRVPDRFQGAATNYQDDISLLTLVSDLVYTQHVRPVCIDFDYEADSRQLKVFSVGKVAGWGVTEEGRFSEVLRVADMPYVSVPDCLTDIAEEYKAYITGDKFCAGYKNGIALCLRDSGGGLTFPARERGTYRHYLRGVASTAFHAGSYCSNNTITSFTHLLTHQLFVQEYLLNVNK
ncbi:modular serine protease-like isoform X2 [Spodoptera frugiperda]|uniref:Modular serine protease-like isoform X2 n=1 Tax=Spodoptera frugiperda TaxID=7108 RepID=A0A9R0E6A6_SPOFR|nr:modular serine protease-like isoform X2 [Spodoptera frugiperda]